MQQSGKYRPILKHFHAISLCFGSILICTFILTQILLQSYASVSDRTLDTQQQFSSYWNLLDQIDHSLYSFSRAPDADQAASIADRGQELQTYANTIYERIRDSRSQDLSVLTQALRNETGQLITESTGIPANAQTDTDSLQAAQTYVQILQDLYTGFYASLENYLTRCRKDQNLYRVYVSIITLISAAVAISFFILTNRELVKMLLKPVQKLTDEAKAIIDDKEVVLPSVRHTPRDEMELLDNAFYGMIEKNRDSMEELRKKGELEVGLANARAYNSQLEARLSRTKLSLLQSRMNPHFIFNTMNLIAGLAVEEEADQTAHFTVKAARYFRYSLDNVDKAVRLYSEVENVRLYLGIQKERFGDMLEYTVQLSEECRQMLVPSMILQPLCENSIIHGKGFLTRPLHIQVKCFIKDSMLVLSVCDDGIGMDEEALNRLKEAAGQWKEGSERIGIGIGNTFQRLQMYYEGKARFIAKSIPMQRTQIAFELPVPRAQDAVENASGISKPESTDHL